MSVNIMKYLTNDLVKITHATRKPIGIKCLISNQSFRYSIQHLPFDMFSMLFGCLHFQRHSCYVSEWMSAAHAIRIGCCHKIRFHHQIHRALANTRNLIHFYFLRLYFIYFHGEKTLIFLFRLVDRNSSRIENEFWDHHFLNYRFGRESGLLKYLVMNVFGIHNQWRPACVRTPLLSSK